MANRLLFFLLKIKFNIKTKNMTEITAKDTILITIPTKNIPVLYSKNDVTNKVNNPIKTKDIKRLNHPKKNFII